MGQNVYLLTTPSLRTISDSIQSRMFVNKVFESESLDKDIISRMALNCKVEYFYVITARHDITFPEFDFTFKPPEWDKYYMHIWNNDMTVRLFNKKVVLEDPTKFTDDALFSGNVKIKNIEGTIYKPYKLPEFDIAFLSYNELYADKNFENLIKRFPRAYRIQGVKGILEAHTRAAEIAKSNGSDMFFVVDADAEVLPSFTFKFIPNSFDCNITHLWYSRNPVNGLEYGYGGIKLFPTQDLLDYKGSPVDFTTSVSKHLKVIPEVSNITKFNTDPFSAWRSGFRECAKLSSKLILNQLNTESDERLRVWCSVNNGEFGDYAVAGAQAGAEFGKEFTNQPDMLRLINDFEWLEWKFNS